MSERLQRIKETVKEKVTFNVEHFHEEPLRSIENLLPTAAVGIAILGSFWSLFKFIITGGLMNQIGLISSEGFEGITNSFTLGNTGYLYGGMFGRLCLSLLLVELVLLVIKFYKSENKRTRYLMTVILGIAFVIFVGISLILAVGKQYITVTPTMEAILQNVLNILMADLQALVSGSLLLVFVLVSSFLILLFTSKSKELFKETFIAFVIIYIAFPAIVVLIENVIPIVSSIVALALALLFLWVLLRFFIGGIFRDLLREGGKKISKEENIKEHCKREKEEEKSMSYVDIKEYSGNKVFYRDKGGYGIFVPSNDCIYYDENGSHHQYVCTVEEYKSGKVVIMLNGKRVTNI